MDETRAAEGSPPPALAAPAATACRGIRGATTVAGAGPDDVGTATVELLAELRRTNGFELADVAAATFTLPDELAGANPAAAAREAGWAAVPLMMVREHGGDARVPNCIRVLVLVNTTAAQADIRHVYLRGAAELRPDLATLS